ncbi:peptidyl-tRNA hydrolase [Hypoxylon sp. FL1857]|nr:peptidyl-tRNA hydrolase [Hypoxylon sp. FL1857]
MAYDPYTTFLRMMAVSVHQTFRPLFLVVSLGNPPPHYDCLHSAGHFALASLQKLLGPSQPPFKSERYGNKSCLASISEKYSLMQSPTEMNISGPWIARAYRDVMKERGLRPSELSLVVVHDDLDKYLGDVKILRWSASDRGHNGVKSAMVGLNPTRFAGGRWSRISIRIDRPKDRDPEAVSTYVLKKMTRYQKDVINKRVGPAVLDCLHELEEEWKSDYDTAAAMRSPKRPPKRSPKTNV